MKNLLILLSLILFIDTCYADEKLPAPSQKRGTDIMTALQARRSIRTYSERILSKQDLSDVLWAAQGVNRPEEGKLTSPTARNRQEIIIYVFTKKGISKYDKTNHSLIDIRKGDYREAVAGNQKRFATAPLFLVMIASTTQFGNKSAHALEMMAADAGIVSENINLFAAATGLCTVTRGIMDKKKVLSILNLDDSFNCILNNPIGYPAQE
ncbi:MAG: SagB/ThcOx family dehydrogenase [Alistipes sp.]|nr:SagB/ThcOx family dehydrogenase [Candidatus Alistipes equi]